MGFILRNIPMLHSQLPITYSAYVESISIHSVVKGKRYEKQVQFTTTDVEKKAFVFDTLHFANEAKAKLDTPYNKWEIIEVGSQITVRTPKKKINYEEEYKEHIVVGEDGINYIPVSVLK